MPGGDKIPADSAKTVNFITQLSNLKAADFANNDDSSKSTFDKVAYTIKINLADNTTQSMQIVGAAPDSARFYCRLPNNPDVSVIFRGVYQNIARDFSGFMP
jgi:hypothetical protein